MTLIVVALFCEAKPMIQYFGLSKGPDSTRFPVYSNADLKLIVSGTGLIKSAVALTYLLTRYPGSRATTAINIGICGSVSRNMDIGTPILFNKIVGYDTGKAFYPDMLLNHGFLEGTLHSFSRPVSAENLGNAEVRFVDMEAAGFMEAAAVFLPPHNIYCLKFVSDYLDRKKLEPGFVSELIQKNLDGIENLIASTRSLCKDQSTVLSIEENEMLDTIGENLKLSVTMKHQFKSLAVHYKIVTRNTLEVLGPYLDIHTNSKFEGKKVFEEIKKLLTVG